MAGPPPAWIVDQDRQVASMTLDYRRDNRRMQLRVVQALTPTARLSAADFIGRWIRHGVPADLWGALQPQARA